MAKDDKGDFNTIRSKSAKELQEAEAVEEEKSTTSEYMDQDGTFRRTKDAYYFEVPVFPKALGKAPKSLGDGPFISRLPLEVCQRPISEAEALCFFQNGKTELLAISLVSVVRSSMLNFYTSNLMENMVLNLRVGQKRLKVMR